MTLHLEFLRRHRDARKVRQLWVPPLQRGVLRALGHTFMPHKATAEAALAGERREALDCRDGAPF